MYKRAIPHFIDSLIFKLGEAGILCLSHLDCLCPRFASSGIVRLEDVPSGMPLSNTLGSMGHSKHPQDAIKRPSCLFHRCPYIIELVSISSKSLPRKFAKMTKTIFAKAQKKQCPIFTLAISSTLHSTNLTPPDQLTFTLSYTRRHWRQRHDNQSQRGAFAMHQGRYM